MVTSVTVGAAMAASCAISPGWFMPSSNTAARCSGRKRSNVSGTPISLLRLPAVARRRASPRQSASMAEIISLVVVLPLLPVTATTGRENCARQAAPIRISAMRVSPSTSCGKREPATACATTAAHAPRASAWSR
ncbi:hypothetical protein D9M68_623170 [compost metagenome]